MPKRGKKKYFQTRKPQPAATMTSPAAAVPASSGGMVTPKAVAAVKTPATSGKASDSHIYVASEIKRIVILTAIILIILVVSALIFR